MKTVRELLETSSTHGTAGLLYIPESWGHPSSNDHAENISRAIKGLPNTHIAVSPKSSIPLEERKSAIKTILGKNFDHRVFDSPHISNAVDDVIKKTNAKHIVVHTEPSKTNTILDTLKETHGSKVKISTLPLPHEIKSKKYTTFEDFHKDVHPAFTRSESLATYNTFLKPKKIKTLNNEEVEVGMFITDSVYTGEVIYIGSNYVTIISDGIEKKLWTNNLTLVEGKHKRDQLFKESFIFKGYKSKFLNRELAEEFRSLSKTTNDVYALLSCIKCCDYIMNVTEDFVVKNFNEVKIQIERARKYTNKFSINIDKQLKFVEESCLNYALLENHKFATTDKIMIARIIANTADVDYSGSDPIIIVNNAVIKLRYQQLNTQGWELLGRMLNVASDAGINWNKDSFSKPIQTLMGLK